MEAGKFGGAARTAQLRADLDKPCAVLHHLPCTIQHTGPARVSDYFLIEESTEDNDPSVLKSSIRGRLLKGSKIFLPPSAQGFVIQREDRGEENQWEVTGVFDSFTYWNHDTEPSAKDKPQQWIEEWPQIAAAIHNPISLEKRRGVKLTTEGVTADETIPHQQEETKADAAHKQEVEEEERITTRKRKRQDNHESSEEDEDGGVAEDAEEETKDSDDEEEAENVAKKEKPKRRKVAEEAENDT